MMPGAEALPQSGGAGRRRDDALLVLRQDGEGPSDATVLGAAWIPRMRAWRHKAATRMHA